MSKLEVTLACRCGAHCKQLTSDGRMICCSCYRTLWQPMENAPKTGETIFVYGVWPHHPLVEDVAFAWWDDVDECWQFDGENMLEIRCWQPLPEPPTNGGKPY